jgi:hypothetical protein
MAFSNAWSNVIPAGSDPANTADDELRQLRLDIDERMDTIVGDWSADPIVALTDIRRTVIWSDGNMDTVDSTSVGYKLTGLGLHPAQAPAGINWEIPLDLPVGAILRLVDFRVFKNAASSTLIVGVNERSDTPSNLGIGTHTVTSTTGWVTVTIGGLSHTVLQDKPIILSHSMSALIDPSTVQIIMDHFEYDLPDAISGAIK